MEDRHFHRLCRWDELVEGQGRMFVIAGHRLAAFRVSDQCFVVDDECPHAGASLARGYVEDGVVSCRIHHWRFQLCDGRYLDQDRPKCDLRSYETRIRDEWLEVEMS